MLDSSCQAHHLYLVLDPSVPSVEFRGLGPKIMEALAPLRNLGYHKVGLGKRPSGLSPLSPTLGGRGEGGFG